MADAETFTQLPLSINPETKLISASDPALAAELADINAWNKLLSTLDTPNQVPAPPAPVNPKRSVQINKLRESGNAAYKKGQHTEAVSLYNLAIQMAASRPPWEASGLVRQELGALYSNRAQALMAQQLWPEAAVDAEASVEFQRVGNVKAWWRRGQCLREMGRVEEALEWVRQGLEFERVGPEKQAVGELEALQRDLVKAVEKSG